MNNFHGQAGCQGLPGDLLKVVCGRHSQNHLGLAVPKPSSEVAAAAAGQSSRNGRVGDLSSNLATPHAQISPDHQHQLHRHEDTLDDMHRLSGR
jgi:hypothetical protein